MADHLLSRRVWLARPREQVFALLCETRHRALVQPGRGFAWRAEPPGRVEAGSLLDFSVRLCGLPGRWRIFVRELDPPQRLVEAGLWGPFGRWEHRYLVTAGADPSSGAPGAWLEDDLTYRLAGGPLGELWLAAGGDAALARAFDARDRRLRAAIRSA